MTTTAPEDSRWRDRAACLKEDPELFFPEGKTGIHLAQINEAKRVCNHRCPVRTQCATWALDNPRDAAGGVWGGLSEDERAALLRKRAKDRQKARAATAASAAAA